MDMFSQAAKAGVIVGVLAALVFVGKDAAHRTVVVDTFPQVAGVSLSLGEMPELPVGFFEEVLWKLNQGRLVVDRAVISLGTVWVDTVDRFMIEHI